MRLLPHRQRQGQQPPPGRRQRLLATAQALRLTHFTLRSKGPADRREEEGGGRSAGTRAGDRRPPLPPTPGQRKALGSRGLRSVRCRCRGTAAAAECGFSPAHAEQVLEADVQKMLSNPESQEGQGGGKSQGGAGDAGTRRTAVTAAKSGADPVNLADIFFWNHAATSLVNEYEKCIALPAVGDMVSSGPNGEYNMDVFTETNAAAMMERCRVALQSYSDDSQLPVPLADLQAFISTDEWKVKRSESSDTILDWVLHHLAGAAGSSWWSMDGISKQDPVPGFDGARMPGFNQKCILVGGEVSRHLHSAKLLPATAASLKEHAMRASLPIDLIFTSAGKDGSAWVSLHIGFDKSLTLLTFDTSTDNRSDQFANLKKNVKAAFASSQRCTNSPVSSAQRSLPTGDMSSNVARTASMVFGGMRAATPKEAPRCMKVWIVTEILRLSRGRSLGQHQTLDSTESNGGSSGGCGADPSGAKGGGSGGGGGGGETGGNDTNSNQGGPEPGGSGASMPSVQRACGGAGDAPGAREGTQGNADDDETDENPGLQSRRKVPCAVGHPVCNVSPRLSCVRGANLPPAISPDDISTRQANLVLHHSHGDQKTVQAKKQSQTVMLK
jgi:hypothetical protein